MRLATLLFTLTGIAVLAGCGSSPHRDDLHVRPFSGPPTECRDVNCPPIAIMMGEAAGICSANDVADIDLSRGPNGKRGIMFTLPDGYEFSNDPNRYAVYVELYKRGGSTTPPPVAVFEPPTVAGKTLTMTFVRGNAPSGKYKFSLSIRRSTGKKEFCDKLDPWMYD